MGIKKIYLLPNLVTTANIFCGFFSVLSSMKGDILSASWWIILAMIFDFLDGRVARFAKATSQFGIEYDSLSDLISFGVAPGILLYKWGLFSVDKFGGIIAFWFVVCGALRLARFNVAVDTKNVLKGYFQGLPIPVAAGFISTFFIFSNNIVWPTNEIHQSILAVVFGIVLGLLMVSQIPFPSFKEFNWRSQARFGVFLLAILVIICVLLKPHITFFAATGGYLVLSLFWAMWLKLRTLTAKENKKLY